MTVRIDLVREVRASVQRVLEYFMNVEELPRLHPEYIKNVRIIDRNVADNNSDSSIEFEQEGSFHGKKIRSVNRLNRLVKDNVIKIETIDGNAGTELLIQYDNMMVADYASGKWVIL